MSRGPGWLQRRLLEELNKSNEPVPAYELMCAVFDLHDRDELGNFIISRAQQVSVSRALGRLADEGAIQRFGRYTWGSLACHVDEPEYARNMRLFCADMKIRWGLDLSRADAEMLFWKHSVE